MSRTAVLETTAKEKEQTLKLELDKEAAVVYEKMTPELRKLAEKLAGMLAREAYGHLLIRYDMGVYIAKVIAEEARYGANAVEQLATFLKMHPNDLYDMRNVTIVFTREQVQALSGRRMADGNHLSYRHLVVLAKVKNKNDRQRLLKATIEHGWSASQLAAEAAGVDKKNVRKGGRKPAKPTSVIAGAQVLYESLLALNNRLESLKGPLFDEIDQMPPDKVDKKLLDLLVKAEAQMCQLEESITGYHERLKKNMERVQRILSSKPASPTPVKAAHDVEDAADQDIFEDTEGDVPEEEEDIEPAESTADQDKVAGKEQ